MKFSSAGTMIFAYEKGTFIDFSVKRDIVVEDPRPKSDLKMELEQTLSYELEK